MPKTKIICTIGPASESPHVIRDLIQNGMNVARLNFSHGTHDEHGKKLELIRRISEELDKPVAILQDLCGPKIRVGTVPEPGIRLEPGEPLILTNKPVDGAKPRVSVSYRDLPSEVKPGDRILLADGMMELSVKQTTSTDIICEVVTGGILTSHKGINLPSGTIQAASLTEKDQEDLIFGLQNDVDYVALSFVRRAEDIRSVKAIIQAQGKSTPIIAKIEKHEALVHIDEIMTMADGIMVARGDLGVEIPLETVPGIQKMLVRKANKLGKPVIIATQMLRSMVNSPRPTRAEATDVANAVLDGADAIMLSEETASGDYPVRAVQFMVKIAENAEVYFPHERYLTLEKEMVPKEYGQEHQVSNAVSYASCVLADHLNASAIVATSRFGYTAMQISRFRPKPAIIALSPETSTIRRLSLYWGCIPRLVSETKDTDERIELAVQSALEIGVVSKGDLIVLTTGHPVWVSGTTNMLKVRRV